MTERASGLAVIVRKSVWLSGLWACLTLLCVLAGPFGTEHVLTASQRAVYWGGVVLTGIVVGCGSRHFIDRFLASGEVVLLLAQPLINALLMTPIFLGLAHSMLPSSPNPLRMAIYVYVVSASVVLIRKSYFQMVHAAEASALKAVSHAISQQMPAQEKASILPEAANLPAVPRLLSRLGPEMQAPVLRLQMRDHYVEVFTATGCEKLLMRFADAIAELDECDGIQVHRSHWVCRKAISHQSRERDRLSLVLSDGSIVPVSRSYRAAVDALNIPLQTAKAAG